MAQAITLRHGGMDATTVWTTIKEVVIPVVGALFGTGYLAERAKSRTEEKKRQQEVAVVAQTHDSDELSTIRREMREDLAEMRQDVRKIEAAHDAAMEESRRERDNLKRQLEVVVKELNNERLRAWAYRLEATRLIELMDAGDHDGVRALVAHLKQGDAVRFEPPQLVGLWDYVGPERRNGSNDGPPDGGERRQT